MWAAHRRDEAQSLEVLARMPDVPLELVADKVGQYASMAAAHAPESGPATPTGTKVALIRRFISDKVDYIAVAKRHLTIKDLSWVLDQWPVAFIVFGGWMMYQAWKQRQGSDEIEV